ncbi:uncharacterized protein [Aristolochia californica]|uniref:uncharacterized protein isoform X2 n=1 Tax=Aristolochia californica TaxID=171875 RepID=UPI0035DDB237
MAAIWFRNTYIWFCEACQKRRESESQCLATSNLMDQKGRDHKSHAVTNLELDENMEKKWKKQKRVEISKLMEQGLFIPDKRKKGFSELPSPSYKGSKSFRSLEAGKVKFISEAEVAHLNSSAKAKLSCQTPGASASLMLRKGPNSTLHVNSVVCRTAKRSFPARSEMITCKVFQNKDCFDSALINDTSVLHHNEQRKLRDACVQASEKQTSQCGNYGSSNEELMVATSKKMEKPLVKLVDASTSLGSIVARPMGERASKRGSPSSTNDLIKDSDVRKHHHPSTLPEIWGGNPTWKGSFQIQGIFLEGNIYHGIQAYCSSSIGHKACEALGRMPGKLLAELLPQSDVWPRSFQKQSPDADDVALYFLHSGCKSSKERYIHFLKTIDTSDLAIKCHLQSVDLLIFSSRHLSVDSQRQTLETYLWGVFYSPSASVRASRNGSKRHQFFWQEESSRKSNHAREVKLEEEGTGDSGGSMNGGVIGGLQRPTPVQSVVKMNISTGAIPRDKMRSSGSVCDDQQTQFKQMKHQNVPHARNLVMQEVPNDSVLMPMPKKINAVVGMDSFIEVPPGFSASSQKCIATGLTPPSTKTDLGITMNDGTGKRIFEGPVQKSSMRESASSRCLNVSPCFSKLSPLPIAKDSQVCLAVANAVRIEPKLHKRQVTDYGDLLPHSRMKPTSCEPILSFGQRDNILSGHGCKVGGERRRKQTDGGTQSPLTVPELSQVHDSQFLQPLCRSPPVVPHVSLFEVSEQMECKALHQSITKSFEEESSHVREKAGVTQARGEDVIKNEKSRVIWPNTSGGSHQFLPARMELESEVADASIQSSSAGNLIMHESLRLSLSRPQYSLNGDKWITALSKEALENDGCGNDEELKLTL